MAEQSTQAKPRKLRLSIWTWMVLAIALVLVVWGVLTGGWSFFRWIAGVIMIVVLFLPTLLTVVIFGFKIDAVVGISSIIAWGIVLYVLIPIGFVTFRRWRRSKEEQRSPKPMNIV